MKTLFLIPFLTINSMLISQAQDSKADEQAIKNILNDVQNGWNEKSGEKFASGFADVHDYIVVNGMYLPALTRQQNAQVHQKLFDGPFKESHIKLKADKINFYTSELAQLTAIGTNYPKEQAVPKDPTIIMTLIVEKKKEGWKIISFHNHELNMEAIKRGSPMPLEVMYATWYKQ